MPIGKPGDLQGYYHWLGTGQMYASARDMAVFLAANLGELPGQAALQGAMHRAQQGTFPIGKDSYQALAQVVHKGNDKIVDKYGGWTTLPPISVCYLNGRSASSFWKSRQHGGGRSRTPNYPHAGGTIISDWHPASFNLFTCSRSRLLRAFARLRPSTLRKRMSFQNRRPRTQTTSTRKLHRR